jgi:mono/diheme cytochrome c family protein
MKVAAAAIASILAIGGGVFWATSTAGDAGLKAGQDERVAERGERLYTEYCASCHGVALEGEPDWRTRDADGYLPAPPHDETGHTWHHPTMQLFDIVKHGTQAVVGGGYRSNMPGFADTLSDDDILAILAFIKSTWPHRIVRRHDELDAAYQAKTR